MERLDELERVADAVEEVRIAERDVPRAGGDLPPHVFQHDVALNHAKAPAVDRHDRTMPAQVFAAAACFRVADRAPLAISEVEVGVARKCWEAVPFGNPEPQFRE